ncbi:PIG-L family deacetylase [Planomonospora sp. ID82291]|uniref:PIG-L family deacetylase n=1 Tax=Planomonospora sp. ID82291 TaxID=2738136 RepID=UPI0018C3F1B5|nr:PIG-L family deacetylase [Planomonospora sp. ID82291]MBG0816483.1 PIG-L family deacetylase [Planomonospora sp. ID82291]
MRSIRTVIVIAVIAALAPPLMLSPVRAYGPGALLQDADAADSGGSSLQVVAHPDDDLLFMSPDLLRGIARGRSAVTVYLTAGEAVAGLEDDRDPVGYIEDRERGVRAAYAWVAGSPDRWRRETTRLGGVRVAVDTLVERPRIKLVFARLPDGGDPRADGGRNALARLWADRSGTACVRAVPPGPACLRRADVLGMLRAAIRTFRPAVLRSLDPDPPAGRRPDHPDHVAAARFAAEAAPADIEVISYRGYPITSLPPNLDLAEREVKRRAFALYRRHDYRVAGPGYDAWIGRMYRGPAGRGPA